MGFAPYLVSALLSVPLLFTAAAADPLAADRPGAGTSPGVVGEGRIHVETGWTRSTDGAEGVTAKTHAVPGILVRVGPTEWLEVRLGWAGRTWIDVESDVRC